MVGFQTNLRWPVQKEIFRMIPGLEEATFARLGQMHRNTFINAPSLLTATMAYRHKPHIWFAGQLTGIEGYVGNVGSGWVAGFNAARQMNGMEPIALPQTTMLGALCYYVENAEAKHFQPMKANMGILPDLENPPKGKRQRAAAYAERAMQDLSTWASELTLAVVK
jgi:methylenetetrahydrofolate--tRNA-(uracil-5-)-methyltransferase